MAKSTDEKPDEKEIEKRIKEINAVSKKVNECSKQLKAAAEFAKELDKLVK